MKVYPRWARFLIPFALLTVAGGLRLWGLAAPPITYWDEQYYVFDASAYLGGGFGEPIGNPPPVRISGEGTWVHPPLGKWMIALGVGPLGVRPLGWRLPSAAFGIAGVGLVYLLGLELWGSVWWAGLAGLLLAVDGLHIVQSRMATLDIFLTTFVTAGVLLLVLDRKRTRGERSAGAHEWRRVDRWFGTPYRLWAGVCLGAAVATKWSGLFALVFGAAVASVWLFTDGGSRKPSVAARVRSLLLCFAAVPMIVYLLAYWEFFAEHGPALHAFLSLQARMLDHGLHHQRAQPENSTPITWPLLLHPIRYTGYGSTGGRVREVLALGNPVVWWGFLLALPLLAWRAVTARAWQLAVVLGGYLAMYVPWFLFGRTQFIFYLVPAVPFMCLGLADAARSLSRGRTWVAAGLAAGAATATVAYAPLWLWLPVSAQWASRVPLLPGWRS